MEGDFSMSENEKKDLSNKQRNPNIALIIIGIVIIVLLGLIAAAMFLNKSNDTMQADEQPKREILVDESNVAEVAQQLEEEVQEHVKPGQYTATMNF